MTFEVAGSPPIKNAPSYLFDHRSTAIVPTLDATFDAANPPAPNAPAASYHGRWSGYVRFPVAARFMFSLPRSLTLSLRTAAGVAVPVSDSGETVSTSAAVTPNVDYRLVVTTNTPTSRVFLRWRSLNFTPAVADAIVPTTALRPAVVPTPPVSLIGDAIIGRKVSVRWSAVSGATGYQVARGPSLAGVDYAAPLNGSVLDTVTERVDVAAPEATTSVYAVKAGFPNPVTGGTTLSAPVSAEAAVPGTIKLNVAATGNGELTLFWNGRPGTAGFNVYESDTRGQLGTLVTPQPVSTPNPKNGFVEAYLHVLTGRPLNLERYYTIVAVDGAGTVTGRSDQGSGEAAAVGLPWRSTNAADVTEALRVRLRQTFTGFNNLEQFTIAGPDGTRYFRDLNGASSYQTDFAAPTTEIGVTTQDGDVTTLQNPGRVRTIPTTPRAYENVHRPNQAGIYRKAEAGPGYHGLFAQITLPETVSIRRRSTANVYAGGSILVTDAQGTREEGHIDMGLSLGFATQNASQPNQYWRLFSNTGVEYRRADSTVIPSGTQAVQTKVRFGIRNALYSLNFVSLDCRAPGLFPDMLLLQFVGPPGSIVRDDGTTSMLVGWHFAFRADWRARNAARMIIKRTNSLAQSDGYLQDGFVRNGNIYATGERVLFGSWGAPDDPNGIFLYPGGTMDENTIFGIGNVPAGNEQNGGSGGSPTVITGFDVASCLIRNRFFYESNIHLQSRR